MNKTLSIIIPAYNASWCLERCIDSLTDETIISDLDILIVDDGSTDETLTIARRYETKYPESIKACTKPNGGHGSVINYAIPLSTGKYVKVLDSDDWVATEHMPAYLNALKHHNADIVLTNFETVDMQTDQRKHFQTKADSVTKEHVYTIDDYGSLPGNTYECATFHGVTYRTEFYQSSGVVLTEKIYYEDQEYATLPFLYAETIMVLDLLIYEYLIGNQNQSVSNQNMLKGVEDIEYILRNFAKIYQKDQAALSKAKKEYFRKKFSELMLSYYVIMMLKNPNAKKDHQAVLLFRSEIDMINSELLKCSNHQYRIVSALYRLGFNYNTLDKLKRSSIYKTLFRIVRN